jgi:hypothetical protein
MRLATVPAVNCGALRDLKALLRCASLPDSDVVLQSQHHSLLSPGGADAKITSPTESRSIQTVSSTPEASVLAGAASGSQRVSRKVAGATCASTSEEFTSPAAKRGRAMSEKIKPHHLERKAILYIRQSTAYQVSHNLESQSLQYAMPWLTTPISNGPFTLKSFLLIDCRMKWASSFNYSSPMSLWW